MSFFSFLKRNKESYSLVFNIGSGSLSGGLVSFTEAPGENVVYYTKENISYQPKISAPRHLELMRQALGKLVAKIQKGISEKITTSITHGVDRVFFIFSSPWSVSQTKIIRVKENRSFKVSQAYLDRLIGEQEKQFQIGIASAGRVIEKKIIQVKINGYVINDFKDKLARELEVAVFFTVVPEEILSVIEETVSKAFVHKNIWCHSFSLATLSVIGNLFPHKEDFMHAIVSEEITDISFVKDGVMLSSASLPLGRNDFMRELATTLNVTPAIADSQIKMQGLQKNDELAAMKLAVAMDKAGLVWLNKFSATIESFKEKIYVPETLFLIADQDLAPFLKNKLERQDFKVFLLDNKKVKPPIPGNDLLFKLELMFLDNIYKI